MSYSSVNKIILIGAETTWGTKTATPDDAGLLISDTSDDFTREITETIGISSIETQKVTTGTLDAGFSMEGDYQHGRLFRYIIGTFTEATATETTHTAVISDNPESLSIESTENATSDTRMIHTGMLAEVATLSIALNENLKLSTSWKGKSTNSDTQAASSAVISTLPVFPHALCTVKIGGTAATEIQNASITINKVVERSGGISSNLFQQGKAVEMKFEFSANLGFTDSTFQNIFLSGTATPSETVTPAATADPDGITFEIEANNGVVIGSGRRAISFILDNCVFSTFTKPTSVGGLIFIDIAGKGTFSKLVTVDNILAL